MFASRLFNVSPDFTRRFSTRPLTRVGFIGLGQMGQHMARNLSRGGFPLMVYDRNPTAIENFLEANSSEEFSVAGEEAEVALESDVIFTMLPNGSDVRDVYFGPRGIFPNGSLEGGNSLFVDSSTIGPQIAQELSRRLEGLGQRHVDAPVTGGVIGAEKGTLTFMCGGLEEDVARLQDIFAVIGRHVFHCGGAGAGQIVKLCNNSVLAVTMMAVSESFRLAKSAGVDLKTVSEVFNCGSAKSWVTEVYNPVPGIVLSSPASNDYKPGFKTELLEKDLRLTVEASKTFSVDLPSVRLAQSAYQQVFESGGGSKDFSVIYQSDLSDQSGSTISRSISRHV